MMTMTINRSDLDTFGLTLSGLTSGVPTVLARSINKGVDGVGPEVKAVVQGTHNIKSTVITKQISKLKATVSSLYAKATVGKDVYGQGKGTAVIDFTGGRQTKKSGYVVPLKKNKGSVSLTHAFVATMKSGHKGVFVRAGYTNLFANNGTELKTSADRNEAIKEVFSTSTVDSLSNSGNLSTMQANVVGRIDKELERQTNLLISRLK